MKPSLTWSRGGGVGRWRCFIQKLGKNPVRARFFLLPSASVGNRFKWNGKRRTPVSCSTKIGRLLFYSKPNKTQLKPRKTFVSKPVFLCEPPWNVVFHFEKKQKKLARQNKNRLSLANCFSGGIDPRSKKKKTIFRFFVSSHRQWRDGSDNKMAAADRPMERSPFPHSMDAVPPCRGCFSVLFCAFIGDEPVTYSAIADDRQRPSKQAAQQRPISCPSSSSSSSSFLFLFLRLGRKWNRNEGVDCMKWTLQLDPRWAHLLTKTSHLANERSRY